MGRYLACGIAINIIVKLRKEDDKIDESDLENIKKHMNNFISMDNYEIDTYDDGFSFTIKKDFLEKNIHDIIREVSNLIYFDLSYLFDEEYNNKEIDVFSKDFNQENYPIILEEEKSDNFVDVVLKTKYHNFDDFPCYDEPYWLYDDSNLFGYRNKYKIRLNPAAIWIDLAKYSGEDETSLLSILNKMKKVYFKNPLSENLIFYIFG